MLVLSRKINEQIRIGGDVLVKVIRTGGRSVKLGIEAPPDVSIVREELSRNHASEGVHAGGVGVSSE